MSRSKSLFGLLLGALLMGGAMGVDAGELRGPRLLTPHENETDPTPRFVWQHVPDATWYRVFIRDTEDNTLHAQWYRASNIDCYKQGYRCQVTPDLSLEEGFSGQWWVQPWNRAAGRGSWSHGHSFTLSQTPNCPDVAGVWKITFTSLQDPICDGPPIKKEAEIIHITQNGCEVGIAETADATEQEMQTMVGNQVHFLQEENQDDYDEHLFEMMLMTFHGNTVSGQFAETAYPNRLFDQTQDYVSQVENFAPGTLDNVGICKTREFISGFRAERP